MKRSRFALLVYWLVVIAAIILLTLWAAGVCRASIADCIDATCRITAGDGGRGTGCAFERSQGHVYVLTAAHVVGNSRSVQCEFWRDGHQSNPLPGVVIKRSPAADAAVIAVPEAAFAGLPPKTIPVAPRDYLVRPGETLTSVGCANGTWSTGWKGHGLGYRGSDLHFVPTPANGRSGSAIFDAAGEKIVGLLRARTGNDSEGIATSVQTLYQAFATGSQSEIRNLKSETTQCPGGSCPPTPWRLLPYRHYQEEKFRQQPPQQQVWPTLPAAPAPPVDLAPIGEKLDRITELLREMRAWKPQPAAPALPAAPPVDEAALKAAQQAKAEAAAVKEASQKAVVEVKQESSKLRELANALIGDRETLMERFNARIAKVKEELGEDAPTREIAKAYVKDLAGEKLGEGTLGLTGGKILGGALGLSAPLAFGIGLGLWFLSRRIGAKIEAGEPLLIQRVIGHLGDKIDDLRDRVRDEGPPAAKRK